jgi:hypothetical protein
MPIAASGALSFTDFDYWFGDGNYGDFSSGPNSNVSLSSYYKGGTYVPNVTPNTSIPASGQISMSQFYGATGRVSTSEATSLGTSGTLSGVKSWGTPTFGGGLSFLVSYNSGFAEQHLYWNSANSTLTYEIGSGSNDAVLSNSDLTFVAVATGGSGYPNEYSRSSATYTAATSTTPNKWTWSIGSSPFGGSGTLYFRVKFYS